MKAAEKLHRFFGKLLRELVHLEATELEVVEHGADLQCCMRRGDDVLKTIPIAGYWLKPIEYWLKRRYNHVAAHELRYE